MKQLPLPKPPIRQPPVSKRTGWWQRFPTLSPKQLLYLAIALVTLLWVVWAFRPAPILVDTGTAERGKLQVTVDAEGKTRVRDRYLIAAPTNGHLERITLNEGDPVQPQMLVARIEPLPLTAAVQAALGQLAEWQAQRAGVATQRPKTETLAQATMRIQEATAKQQQATTQVARVQAAWAQAQRDRARAEQLATTGAISRQAKEAAELTQTTQARELEAAQLAAQVAASEVEVARAALAVLQREQTDPDYLLDVYDARIASTEAELAKLRDEANRTDIRSPLKGRVLRIVQKSAQFVTEGTPLLELGDTTHLELVIDVLSSDAERIKPGAPILIERADAQPIRAKVQRVEPAAFTKISALGVEEQRVNVIGEFVDVPIAMGDAYRVETKIVIWEGQAVLKVPLSALFRCDQSWCVFGVQGGRALRRSVELNHRSNFEAEIQTGLTAGEVVILHPNEQIESGKAVRSR
jgi:HlyD family secretion protein